MANDVQILDKIERNARQLGLTVVSRTTDALVIDNGSNDLTVSYVAATIEKPMGGIDDSTSPFLGIGVANPGKIQIKSAISTGDDMTDIMDSLTALQLFHICAGHANNILVENSDASFAGEIKGHADLLGMGQ